MTRCLLGVRTTVAAPLLLALLCTAGCDDAKDGAAAAPGSAAQTAAAPSAAATTEGDTKAAKAEPTADAEVSCKALISHIVEVQEAEKKDGLIRRSNADKMEARCEKAANMKDNGEAVKCVMAAKDVKALGDCKDMGKLIGPW